MVMHDVVRRWIVEVLEHHQPLLTIAVRQRAKFEGWLKFELAALAEQNGATSVCVEPPAGPGAPSVRCRSDLGFDFDRVHYDVELKTPNCNWRLPGAQSLTRPITQNIAEIAHDARKLAAMTDHGLVAFVLFPVPPADRRWHEYLDRISTSLAIPLRPDGHTAQITVPLGSHAADLVVCCFDVRGAALSATQKGARSPDA